MPDLSKTPSSLDKTATSQSALTHGTWVLVADGGKALLLQNTGDADLPVLALRRLEHLDNPPTRDQGSDRPGRSSDGPGGQRSAVQNTDWHQLAEDRFAGDLAEMLRKRVEHSGIDRLIIVAAPRVLGDLRAAFHPLVADRIVAELAMDLTNHPVQDMARLIGAASAQRRRD